MLTTPFVRSSRFDVAELSVQPDGGFFLVGNPQLGFYQFPPEAVDILEALKRGVEPDSIRSTLGKRVDSLDVEDFIGTLVDIRFLRDCDEPLSSETYATDRRWLFRVPSAMARRFFSPAAMALYATLLGVAAYCLIRYPPVRPRLDAFFLDHDLTATLVLLLVLSSLTTAFHELGHLLAAAAKGVESRVGIGTRLWNVVVEADLSGIMALPKKARYLPLLAGMAVDVLSLSLITIIVAWLVRTGGDPFAINLLRALTLQLLVTISWQFNVFLRTDVYYVLSAAASYPNLDGDARRYLRSLVPFERKGEGEDFSLHPRRGTLRAFAAAWLVGRFLSVSVLLFIVLPTLARYCDQAWTSIVDPDSSLGGALDAAIFATMSLLILAVGMFLWLRPRFINALGQMRRRKGGEVS